jgi:hypothetical protein
MAGQNDADVQFFQGVQGIRHHTSASPPARSTAPARQLAMPAAAGICPGGGYALNFAAIAPR